MSLSNNTNEQSSTRYRSGRITELALIFGCVPIVLTVVHPMIAVAIGLIAVVYCIVLIRKHFANAFRIQWFIPDKHLWLWVGLRFLAFALLSTLYVYLTNPNDLFRVVSDAPLMWIGICVFYTLVSAIPQEIFYRFFFYERYAFLLNNQWLFIVLNAGLFSLAHTMFNNTLVFILTFIGGLLFAHTYYQTRSLALVCIEHTAYGLWLYTVGMGAMLAFPMPQ